ncbi:MAG: hypothetical protein GXO94_06605 [Nitrospirae bacterium]|nr:hypothetical protein [Nitrospirota bacterium]
MKTINDEELVALVKDEDSQEAFEELLGRYRPIIYSIAGRIFYAGDIQHATKLDAIDEGVSALGLAIMNYDRSEGRFKRYAVKCIQGAIMNYVNGNRSIVKPLALQRRLQKVRAAVRAVTDKETGDYDPARVRAYLLRKYPGEALYWERFLDGYMEDIADAREDVSLDRRPEEGGTVRDVPDEQSLAAIERVERREISRGVSRVLMISWLEVIRKELKKGNRRSLEVLYRYYVKGDPSGEIIRWLDGSGLKGYDLFRQVVSRGFRQLCGKYRDIFRGMVADLNRMLDHVFVGEDAERFCDELRAFLQTLAETGVLAEGYDAQS